MRKRLLGVLATSVVVFGACQGAATSSPSSPAASTPAESAAASAPAGSAGASASTGEIKLTDSAYKAGDGTDGGQLIIGDWQEANTFQPFYESQQSEANVDSATFATLVVFSNDFKYIPDLAKDVPTTTNGGVKVPGDNGDAQTVTWTLKDGLKWSDGQPLTCADFKYTVGWVLDPANVGVITAGFSDLNGGAAGVECKSDTQMVLHFKNVFEGYITMFNSPLPEHYLSKFPMKDQVSGAGWKPDQVKDLPTSGAFKFDTVTPGQQIKLVKNPNYLSFSSGKPTHLDSLIFKWYGDADAMIAGFKAGEVDEATDLNETDLPKVEDLGEQVSSVAALTYEFLRPNWGATECSHNPAVADRGTGCPMSDPAMRQALAYAIDKNEINNRILAGKAQIANTNITPSAWFYADQPPVNYDPAKAASILDAAGWVPGADGIRVKDGLRAKVELCTTTRQARQDTLALVAGWLKAVGVEAVPNAVDSSNIFGEYNETTRDTPCVLSRFNFDIAEHAFSSSIDPLGNYFNYHSSQFPPDGQNDAQIKDPDIDASMDAVKNSVDFVKIKEAMATFQKVFVEKTVEVPLYYRKNVDLVTTKVGNFTAQPTQAGPTWNAVDWFVKGA
jgi:peptide/nickel transport system substrate-binding protein